MANKAVTRITLEVNGQEFTNLQSYNENERIIAKSVKYMNKRGSAGITPEYGFSINVVLDKNENADFLEAIEDATIVIEYEGGDRVIFLNVRTISIGEQTANGEDEIVYPVAFTAEERKPEPA